MKRSALWSIVAVRLGPLTIAAASITLLTGCNPSAQQQYLSDPSARQQYLSDLTPEKCRALQAVIADREMYGIVAPSSEEDQAAVQRCPPAGLETGILRPTTTSTSAASDLPSTATSSLKDEVRLQQQNGVFMVPVVINGAVSIPFVLDSGATEVQLPAEVVFTLIRTGTLSEEDFIGASTYVLADGRTLRSPRLNIREMRIGERIVRNVAASVGPAISSDALLGQSFLSKLRSWTLDNKRHVLILAR